MAWLQFRIVTDREHSESVEDAVLSAGALSVTMTDEADTPILEPGVGETPLWQDIRVLALFDGDLDPKEITAQLARVLPRDSLSWEIVEDQPWERAWMDHFEPIRCGDRLWVCPSWQEPPQADAVNLILDPGLAFGSGTHPTTFLCLQWLDSQDLQGKTVVDFGCGSGILGIAALLLGADQVIAIDNDPQALIATKDNLSRNHLSIDRLQCFLPEEAPRIQADIIVANILAEPLINLADNISEMTAPKGLLCLSGILSHQAATVAAAYSGFSFDPVTTNEEWARLNACKLL